MNSNENISKVLIWGGGSKSRLILEMLKSETNVKVGCIFDSTLKILPYSTDTPFLNETKKLTCITNQFSHYIVCVGSDNGYARLEISNYLELLNLVPYSIISPNAYVATTATIGTGCQIMPGALIHHFASIGNQCVINSNSTIDHESVIGHGVHIMGSAAIAGRVNIGDYSSIGTNATILPDITIGKACIIGAGSVVTKNVPDYSVYVGIPARFLKKNCLKKAFFH